jgi:NAD dependent epimerase/dehydratase family enzyme
VGIILHLLEHKDLTGPFNLSVPNPLRYKQYAELMGELTGKRSNRKLSSVIIRIAMGMVSDMILYNRRMIPDRALNSGHVFRYPEARKALQDLFGNAG